MKRRCDLMDGETFLSNIPEGHLANRMGIQVTEFSSDRATASMPVAGNTQNYGQLHGGAYVVLGETLGSLLATYNAPENVIGVGIDVNATHTGAASIGQVTAVCTPVHVGRSLAVHETRITNEAGRLCSTIRITNFYKQLPPTNENHS